MKIVDYLTDVGVWSLLLFGVIVGLLSDPTAIDDKRFDSQSKIDICDRFGFPTHPGSKPDDRVTRSELGEYWNRPMFEETAGRTCDESAPVPADSGVVKRTGF